MGDIGGSDGSGVAPEQLTRRPRRRSRKTDLDNQALAHGRRRSSIRVKKKAWENPGNMSSGSPKSAPSSPRDFVLREEEREAQCGLEELVLTGAAGRKADEARSKRAKAEKWRKAMIKPDEDDTLLDTASKELEKLLAGITAGKQVEALKDLAFSPPVGSRRLSFEQLVDALESVDNGWKRTVVLLCLAPQSLVKQDEFLPGHGVQIPALPKAARCLTSVVMELAQAATRLRLIEKDADECAARAASAAAALESLIARTDTTDIDSLRAQLAAASDAKLESDLASSRAHEVGHTGLIAETLVSPLAECLQREDFVDVIIEDDDDDLNLSDRRNCLVEAARRCATDILHVAYEARGALHRILAANRIAKAACDSAKNTLALALDEKDTLEDQREWQSHGVRADLETRARNNFETFSAKLKAPPDQISFDVPASSRRLALTLAALLRYKKLHTHSSSKAANDEDEAPDKHQRDSSFVFHPKAASGTRKKLLIGTKSIL